MRVWLQTTDTAADRKKTDEVVADVKEENEENEEKEKEEKEKEEGSEEGAQEGDAGPVGPEGDEGASTRSPKKATKSKKAKKSDLNTETVRDLYDLCGCHTGGRRGPWPKGPQVITIFALCQFISSW